MKGRLMSEERKLQVIKEAEACGFRLMVSRFKDIGGPNVVNLVRMRSGCNVPRGVIIKRCSIIIVTEREIVFRDGTFTPYVYGLIEGALGIGVECPDDGEEALMWLTEKVNLEGDPEVERKLKKAKALLAWSLYDAEAEVTQVSLRENGEVILYSSGTPRRRENEDDR